MNESVNEFKTIIYSDGITKPFRLSEHETKKPDEVIKEFITMFHLAAARSKLTEMIKGTFSYDENHKEDRLEFGERLQKFLDAIYAKFENERYEYDENELKIDEAEERFLQILSHELAGKIGQIVTSCDNIDAYKTNSVGDSSVKITYELSLIKEIAFRTFNLIKNLSRTVRCSPELDIFTERSSFYVVPFLSEFSLPFSTYDITNRQKLNINILPLKKEKITTDREKLSVILTNLLDNAFKYGESDKQIKLECDWKDALMITVSSQGQYIPESKWESIFYPFRKLQHGGTGVGLGLYIARLYARSLGGDVTLKSFEDGLTIFKIELPETYLK